jgi:nucleotide-binding universal stress UspA family protein
MEQSARQDLATILNRSRSEEDLEVSRVAEQGDPAVVISDYAERQAVDLIMMPTRGYGRFRSLLLGSVTAKVLHDAKCPVWTAAHLETAETPPRSEYQTVLCGIDATSKSVTLIRFAHRLAQEYGARLLLAHSIATPEYGDPRAFEGGWLQFLLDVAREEIAKLQGEANTSLKVHLDFGSVPKVMHAAAVYHDADLVVIGRGRIHGTFGRLRTQTYSVISHSPCPVLSV